ncbi:MAG: hypothetical protein KDK39_16355, partial [Leptospiraceae bacterium]|nr:hypothetical protein [Leptospiraceae bacterium]
ETALQRKARKATVASIKDVVGSGLSSAGAFQMAAAACSIESGTIPGIRNYHTPDPELHLKFNTRVRKQNPRRVLVSSHGVTGINSVISFKRFKA